MKKWAGSFGILLTPFREDGTANLAEIERQVDLLCETKIAGIVVCGSSSEFVFCKSEENMEIIRITAQTARGRKPIIAGATSPGRDQTLAHLHHMYSCGVENALIAPPYFFRYTEEEILQFYKEISTAGTGVDILAYNVPFFTNTIGETCYTELLNCKHVVGIKNSGQNIREISNQAQMREAARPDFAVLTGTEEAFFPCLAAGCDGAFTAFGALLPDYMAEIYTFYQSGQYEQAHRMQEALLPLLRICNSLTFPIGYKLFGELTGHVKSYYPQSLPPGRKEGLADTRSRMAQELEAILTVQEKCLGVYQAESLHVQ